MADQQTLVVNSATPVDTGLFYYKLNTNQGDYFYTPYEFVQKGLLQGNTQYFETGILNNPDVIRNSEPIVLQSGLLGGMESAGYNNPTQGFLIKPEDFNKIAGENTWDLNQYDITAKSTGKSPGAFGPITGIGEVGGETVYARATQPGYESSFVRPNGNLRSTYTKYKFGALGKAVGDVAKAIGDVPLLTEATLLIPGAGPAIYGTLKGAQAGAAGESPLKAGVKVGVTLATMNALQSAMGAEAGLTGGETGPFDVAGNPDILGGSSAVALGNVSPEPGAFDVGGNPDIMVQQPPTTGAFDVSGATGTGLELPAEPTTGAFDVGGNPDIMGNQPISLSDAFRALRTANSINSLLNPQQPQGTAMQGGAPMAATGVDYSGLYSLLGQRPVQTGLLGTQYQPQPINLASLLG